MQEFAQALHRVGARDSEVSNVAHFCSYHLADLEGENGGWLGRNHLKDELDRMVADGFEDLEEEEEEEEDDD